MHMYLKERKNVEEDKMKKNRIDGIFTDFVLFFRSYFEYF